MATYEGTPNIEAAAKAAETQKRHCDELAAAEYLDVSVSTMRDWRIRKRGPVYAKFGKAGRYPMTELEKYAEAAKVRMAA